MLNIKDLLEFSKPLRVLYVEDDLRIRNNYEKVFKEMFRQVDLAADGAEGVKAFIQSPYDIVITDINMPNMNGIEMIQNIFEKHPEQSIIVTSAHDEPQYLLELIELGIEKFLIKPLDFSKMIAVLFRTCRRLHQLKELQDYQNRIEEENLRSSALVRELTKKNEELEETIHKLTRKENVTITLVDSIEKEKSFSSGELKFYTHKLDTLSAHDFIETFAGDIEVLNDRFERVEETLELLIHQKLLNPNAQSLEELSNAFYDYGTSLTHLYKFTNLSEALHNFATILGQVEDLDTLKEMKAFLFGISDSLQKWRQEVLVERSAQDIHFLDNSIISDCIQTESMLAGGHQDEDLDDLFF